MAGRPAANARAGGPPGDGLVKERLELSETPTVQRASKPTTGERTLTTCWWVVGGWVDRSLRGGSGRFACLLARPPATSCFRRRDEDGRRVRTQVDRRLAGNRSPPA